MKPLSYLIQYWALELLGLVFRMLPPGMALSLGSGLGLLAYRMGMRREVALSNLARVFPDRPQRWRKAMAGKMYSNLGRNLAELLRFPLMSAPDVLNIVEFCGSEHFDQALSKGQGALLITAHFGNWELFGAAIASAGYPLSVVVYPQHNRWVDESLNRLRRGKGAEIIYKREAAREILRSLKQNRFVAILMDQDAGPDGIFVDFLGHPASTARGPAVFAIKTGAPLITGALVRSGPGKHIGYIDPPIYADPEAPAETEVRRLTELISDNLCRYIRQHPDHWYWVHKRWKTRPS